VIVKLIDWGLMALSAQIGYIIPLISIYVYVYIYIYILQLKKWE